MDSKLSILLLLSTVAGISLAQDSGSCVAETSIGDSLAIIQLAEDKPLEGLNRVAQLVNGEILTILTEKSQGLCINSEEAESRAESAEEESLAAFLYGIPPTVEAVAIFQTELNVSANVDLLDSGLQELHGIIWAAIKTVRNAEDYNETQAALANASASAQVVTEAAIDELFNIMLNGTAVIPEEDKDVIACVGSQAASALLAAAAGLFQEISVLLEAIFDADIQTNVETYSCQIAALQEEVLENVHFEVVTKVSILRNLVIADYLNNTGIVTGLFALQSV